MTFPVRIDDQIDHPFSLLQNPFFSPQCQEMWEDIKDLNGVLKCSIQSRYRREQIEETAMIQVCYNDDVLNLRKYAY